MEIRSVHKLILMESRREKFIFLAACPADNIGWTIDLFE